MYNKFKCFMLSYFAGGGKEEVGKCNNGLLASNHTAGCINFMKFA